MKIDNLKYDSLLARETLTFWSGTIIEPIFW